MSLYEISVPQFIKMLNNLGAWLDAGVALGKKKSFEPGQLLEARLAPDQYPLLRQIQAACDAAKFGASRLSGKEPPKHPDTETTLDEIRQRIRAAVAYLETLKPKDFEGAEARQVVLPFAPGKVVSGQDYLVEMALPNFYFHVTHAYAILRHNGVEIGKMAFLGSINFKDA